MLSLSNQIENTVQDHIKKGSSFDVGFLFMTAAANDIVPSWWSVSRDIELRKFWKSSDHLSGALFTVITRLSTIPFHVEARDMSIKTHVRLADAYSKYMIETAQFGEGWIEFLSSIIEDQFGQDNGSFFEIIGDGAKDQEIRGNPYSFAHLDSACCVRTGDPTYPVVYNESGEKHKLHFTRVVTMSQMPSSNYRMYGVGFSAISRCINVARNLMDIAIFKQEKLGSRPMRRMLITKGGLDPEDIEEAVRRAEISMGSRGLTRYSRNIVIGDRNVQQAEVQNLDLTSMDGFDEETSTIYGMATVSLAFGMDARELFPVVSSSGKADAVIQHMKQRGRALGQTIQLLENKFNQFYLPPFLKMVFDYQDDAEDRQAADIRQTRATTRQYNLKNLVTDVRTEREIMLGNAEITKEQFIQLELNDGRTEDGVSVETLFYSEDAEIKSMLSGVTESNFESKEEEIMTIIATSKSPDFVRKARQCLAAIVERFEKPLEQRQRLEQQMALSQAKFQNKPTSQSPAPSNTGQSNSPDESYRYERTSNKKPTSISKPQNPSKYTTNMNEGK